MKSKLCFLFVVGMLLLFAVNLNAQVKAGSFTVSPIAGYSYFPNKSILENASTYGASLGYNFTEYLGIEASYNTIATKIVPGGVTEFVPDPNAPPAPPGAPQAGEYIVLVPGGTEVSGYQTRIECFFHLYPGNKFAPYAAIGIGTLSYDYNGISIGETNLPVGFGLKYFFTDKIALRADFRSMMPHHNNNVLITVGATFQFGGR